VEVGGRVLLRAWVHLAVLWAFAFAQPVLQVLADSATFMVARGNAWPDLVLVTLGLVLLPPTVMVGIEALLPRPSQRKYLHLAFVGLLSAAFVFQVLKGVLVPGLEACLAVAFGAGFAFAYGRGRFVPTVLTVLSPIPVLLLTWFLGFSPASELAWPGGPELVRGTVPAPVPVVVVIFDELSSASLINRRRNMDARRWPNFAALAKESTWYRNATTVADQTTRAVPTIMTGQLRGEGLLPIRADHPGSLFDRLGGQYDYNVKETLTHLCADELCEQTRATWPTRARRLVGSMASIMRSRLSPGESTDYIGVPPETVERRPETFREFVARIEPGRMLSLHHADLPHSPYQYTASGRRYTTETDLPGLSAEQWTEDPAPVRTGLRRYLMQLGLVDKLVGELVGRLKRIGLFDRALVVVAADHGVSFRAGDSRRNVSTKNIGEIAGVPMLIKTPGQRRGRIVDSAATTEDILPTIGSYLGARWSTGGRSLENASSSTKVTVAGENGPVKVSLGEFIRLRNQAADRIVELNR
jgi:Sulfatase